MMMYESIKQQLTNISDIEYLNHHNHYFAAFNQSSKNISTTLSDWMNANHQIQLPQLRYHNQSSAFKKQQKISQKKSISCDLKAIQINFVPKIKNYTNKGKQQLFHNDKQQLKGYSINKRLAKLQSYKNNIPNKNYLLLRLLKNVKTTHHSFNQQHSHKNNFGVNFQNL